VRQIEDRADLLTGIEQRYPALRFLSRCLIVPDTFNGQTYLPANNRQNVQVVNRKWFIASDAIDSKDTDRSPIGNDRHANDGAHIVLHKFAQRARCDDSRSPAPANVRQ
jgi:hypothetical protein